MNKIILVHYIRVGNSSAPKVDEILSRVRKHLVPADEDIISYVIPVKDEESRVECINPRFVTEEEYESARRSLDKAQKALDEVLEKLNR